MFNIKHIEAAVIRILVNTFVIPNEAKLEALVAAEAPAGAEALFALVEKDDSALGPVASGAINGLLNAYHSQIDAEIEALVQQGITGVPALIKAILAIADKLAA